MSGPLFPRLDNIGKTEQWLKEENKRLWAKLKEARIKITALNIELTQAKRGEPQ